MLSEQLAMDIVTRTMSILKKNVNVMDRSGTIIGSGDATRVGHLHDGARKVIEHQETVEISSAEAGEWSGSKPGINLPIRFHSDIVGVIGVTGEPEEIRNYSKLVQMGAELTLEQAFLTKEIQRSERIRDEVFSHLLLGSDAEQEYMMERARSLQVNIHETYSVVIIALPREQKNDSSMEMLEKWVKTWLVPGDELIHLYTNNYVVLKKKAPPLLTTDEKFVEFMEQKAKNLPFNNPMITVGPFSEGIVGWRQSFQTAKTMKETAEALYPQGGVWDQNKLGLATLCYRFLKETNKDSLAMIDRYRRLLSDNDGEELQRTFLTYLEENGEMAKTAEKLFIHRNTLSYRLEKIHIITGKNPKNLLDLLELKLGQLLYSLAAKQ